MQNNVRILHDIIDRTGNFLTQHVIREKFGNSISTMKYNSLISAIPKKWMNVLHKNVFAFRKVENIQVLINKVFKVVSKVKC